MVTKMPCIATTSGPACASIMKTEVRTLNMRLDILTMTLTELARSLPVEEAARAAKAIGERVAGRVAGTKISTRTDTTVAADLAPILAALRRH